MPAGQDPRSRTPRSARCAAPAAPPEFKLPDAFGVQYGLGAAGGASCPVGMFTMLIAASCERAAAVAGRPYGGNVTAGIIPKGCMWSSAGGSFYFSAYTTGSNQYDSGRGHASAQPVCAGAPASTQQRYPLRANIMYVDLRVRVRVHMRVCMWVCGYRRVRVCVHVCVHECGMLIYT